ncbi:MAG: amino acid ABC transporter permease [Clostridiales bacterium]|nr:amino acid ABC transporter permease [Clostridiales bacterium]
MSPGHWRRSAAPPPVSRPEDGHAVRETTGGAVVFDRAGAGRIRRRMENARGCAAEDGKMVYLKNPARLAALLTQMWNGLGATLFLFFAALLLSLPLGLGVALLRRSRLRAVRGPVGIYVLIMRGTPLILQIFTIYFALPLLLGRPFDRMGATVIAFVLNYAAYFAEIYRGGMDAIPSGQWEAGKALGMPRTVVFTRIILPQMARRVLLPVSNEVITLVKDTALVTAVGVVDLYRAAKNATSTSGSLVPLFLAGVVYLGLNALVTWVFSVLHRRWPLRT